MLIFPKLIGETYPVKGRPVFDTIEQKSSSGMGVRIGKYVYPLNEWDIPYNWVSADAAQSDYQTLKGFCLSVYGMMSAFLFRDPSDCSTTDDGTMHRRDGTTLSTRTPSILATGDGTTTTFQIGRTIGGFLEVLFDIDSTVDAPKIYLNTTLQASGYTISATGLITFASAPGSGVLVKADFNYYWRVNFAEDNPEFSQFVFNWYECTLKLKQVRVQ